MSQDKETAVNGVTYMDYQSWLHHPVTKMAHQFQRDFRAALHREMIASFEAGSLELATEHEARGRCKTLAELADMPFESIVQFYQPTEEETDEGRQTAQGL